MAEILCTNCSTVHDDNMPCGSGSTILNRFDDALSQVTVEELSSGCVVFYRPPVAESESTTAAFDPPSNSIELHNFEKIAEVINPFLDDLRFPSYLESTTEKSFSGDLFIDPVDFIIDEYKSSDSEKISDDPFDSFSDISDFMVPDIVPPKPPKLPGDLTLQDFTDDLSEESKAQTKQEFFEDAFKPVKHEPLLSKAEKEEIVENVSPDRKPISAAGWLGIILLMFIPVLNLFLLIIWAFGGCLKKSKTSFARAALILFLIFAVIVAVAWFAFGDVIYGAVHSLLVKDGSPSALTNGILGAIQTAVKFFGIDITIAPTISV